MNTTDTPADGLRQIAEDIYAAHLAPLHAQITALTAQRDALKTALEAVAEQLKAYGRAIEAHNRNCDHEETISNYYIARADDMEKVARAALALVKGDA